MKQLYSAGPLPGSATSAPGRLGPPAFKAASQGLRPEDVKAALPYTAYAPPPARNGESHGPLPVRLALLNTPAAGRMLAHVAPNGGTYFAHALLNVPATADAQLAIQTWGSPLWQRHEPDTAGDLPELPYLPVADVLDDEALRVWLADPGRRDLVEFVLSALLSTPSTTRIFVAAPADDVAKVVYAVTRSLPPGLLDDFTFSTYEPEPLHSPARLVGCDTGAPEWDLPAGCYEGTGVAYNPTTGRKSELKAEVPFAAFAVKALAEDVAPLDEFRATWQRLGLTDPRQFDLVYRLTRGTGSLTKDESSTAVQNPTLAAWVSARSDVVHQLLEWALDDTAYAHLVLSRVVVPLRQKADAVARLSNAVRQAGFAAVKDGDRLRVLNAFEVILPMAAPGKAGAVWSEVLSQVANPDALSWEMRWHLLPRLIRFRNTNGGAATVDPALMKWLDVPAEKLGELLGLDLPKAYHLAAARVCLNRDDAVSATFAKAVAAQPALVLQLLQPCDAITEERAATLFETLIVEVPSHPWFEDVLASATTFSADRRNRFFEVVLAAGKVDADHVIRSHGNALLDLFSGQSGLDRLGRLFLAAPPTDVFTSAPLLDFLGKLKHEPRVGDDVKDRIEAVQAVRGFLDKPDFAVESLRPVAVALTTQPVLLPPSARTEVLGTVNAELTRRANSTEFQHDLEIVLVHLGDALSDGPTGLYRELLRRQRERRDFGRHPNTVQAFLAVALGAARSESAAKQTEGLEGEAFAVAATAAERGGRRLLAELDTRSKDWPKAARAQWGFLAEAVRPKGVSRAVRDCLLFAAGAGIASAVWFVVAQLVK
jgi:hypothetical protein